MRKMKSLRNAVMLSMLTTSVVWGGTAFANAADLQEFDLDTMVVTASRVETAKVDTPANVSVVTAEKIENRHYQNVAEALKDVPGATVLDNGEGANEKSIVINGDTRVLVLVDGRRMDIATGGINGRSSFDLGLLPDVNTIDRIEVLKGAGGALYGSDAVGGVVNIITKKMDHSYGKVSMGFGSNQARDAKAMYTIKEGKTGVMVAASKYKQGYYKYKDVADKVTKRWPVNSSIDGEKVSLKISQELTEDTNIEIGYDYDKYNGFSRSKLSNYYGTSYNDKKYQNIYAKYNWKLNGMNEGYFHIYHNELDYTTNSVINGWSWGDVKSKTNGIDLQQAWKTSDNNKLVVGASCFKSDIDNYQDDSAVGDRKNGYSEDLSNKAIFVNDNWEFLPSWSLNAGVRYDDHSKAGDKTTLSAGLNKKFTEYSHAYFNWGQVFKAPTGTDLFDPFMGNKDLKPEKGDTWTFGYGTKINNKTDVNISYFQSNLKDAINYDPSNSWKAGNVDKQKKNGMELSVNHELNDNWDLEVSYSYVRVRNDNNDGQGFVRDVNYVPNIYRLGVRYHNDLWNADLFLRAGSGADKASYVDSSYVTLDASVAYKATKDLSFYAKGYNLFNKAYAEYAGIYNGSYDRPAQSRRFIVGAEYSF